jgi:3'-phosphoadenosine 5'-phosphosulfate sulfotransferase (PAPS reductase)/FAD synthetase
MNWRTWRGKSPSAPRPCFGEDGFDPSPPNQKSQRRTDISNPYKIDTPARISFSGGRTSGYLLYHILQAFDGKMPEEVIVTFANTGREVEETLEFVRDCERHWGVKIHWIEYCRDDTKPAVRPDCGQKRIGCHSFREVTFETAARNGEPFRALIEVKADFRREAKGEVPILPNPTDRWCSGELKQRTMDRFMKSLDLDEYTVAVGIRADEAHRADSLFRNNTSKITFVTPLVPAGVTQDDVQAFWKAQPFDLKLRHDPELGTYEGNCDGCFLKRNKKILTLVNERPAAMEWWAEQEEWTGQTFRRDRPGYRTMLDNRIALDVCDPDDRDLGACLCTE